MKPGARSLVADLARAGAPAEVRRDAAAGDFDPITGDPAELQRRWPGPIADAAAVRAYDVRAAVSLERPPAAPRRFIERPPTTLHLVALAALRRLIDAGTPTSAALVAREARIKLSLVGDVLAGMVDRGLVELIPVPDRQPRVLLGPRAAAYQERDVRTERSQKIEALIRAGQAVSTIIASTEIKPTATRAEVYRIRATYCPEVKLPRSQRSTPDTPTGASHQAVVERYRKGDRDFPAMARDLAISRERVRQILENARRRGELPAEVEA